MIRELERAAAATIARRTKGTFVTGMGRSGTVLLSKLAALDPSALALHEPIAADMKWFGESGPDAAAYFDYERTTLLMRVYVRSVLAAPRRHRLVEVNSALRFAVPQIRMAFPKATVLHLVRDPVAVVASLWHRQHYQEGASGHHVLEPSDEATRAVWPAMSRFEKLCWLWATPVRQLLAQGIPLVRLEDVVACYPDARHQFLDPAGLRVSEEDWRRVVKVVENPTQGRDEAGVPWDQGAFERHCGELRVALGYDKAPDWF